MEPTLRSTQVMKQEAKDIGLTGKEVAKYVREQQTLDREERAPWRDTQKRQIEIRMAELQAEEKKRADKIQADIQAAKIEAEAEEKKRADEIKIQMAKIEADKELTLKEIELKAQDQAGTSAAAAPPPQNRDAKSPKLPSFIVEKHKLDSYLLHFERYVENASWEKKHMGYKVKCTTDRKSHGRLYQDVRYRCQ